MSNLMSVSDDVKFAMERYSDIVKLRAAQVLALFVMYALALRGSENFLDGSSILALTIPVAAGVFDYIAIRHYMCPYAYAAFARTYQISKKDEDSDPLNSVPGLVLDYLNAHRSEAVKIFDENEDEGIRRQLFRDWFIRKDQRTNISIFAVFFFVALVSTGAFQQ